MKPSDLPVIVRGVVPILREYIAVHLSEFADRIAAMEQKVATVKDGTDGEPGPQGDKGDAGLPGQDGAIGDQGPQGPPGEPGKPGEAGPQGEPGTPGDAGPEGVKGMDGAAGRDGRDGLPGVQGEKGFDGKDGRDGMDGLGFDDMEAVYDDAGRMSLRFVRGEVVKEFRVPGIVDLGVYKAETVYQKGDGVTFASSFWIAQKDTTAKPGYGSTDHKAWRLAVKRGADGKSGT